MIAVGDKVIPFYGGHFVSGSSMKTEKQDANLTMVFQFHARAWDCPNGVATDDAGNWYLCRVDDRDNVSNPKPAKLAEVCEWFIQAEPFAGNGSSGSINPVLAEIVKQMRPESSGGMSTAVDTSQARKAWGGILVHFNLGV